jgi:hypothetical protein
VTSQTTIAAKGGATPTQLTNLFVVSPKAGEMLAGLGPSTSSPALTVSPLVGQAAPTPTPSAQGTQSLAAAVPPAPATRSPPSAGALSKDMTEAAANQLLEENVQVINIMRENLVTGKVSHNIELMARFQNNISTILKW